MMDACWRPMHMEIYLYMIYIAQRWCGVITLLMPFIGIATGIFSKAVLMFLVPVRELCSLEGLASFA